MAEPQTVKIDPTHGAYCSHHGYGHRVLCPGCSTTELERMQARIPNVEVDAQLDRAFINYELPDGKKFSMVVRIAKTEHSLPKWEHSIMRLDEHGHATHTVALFTESVGDLP